MPTFKICKGGTSASCGSLFLDDLTTYGNAPEARPNYALFLVGFFYQENLADTPLVIDNTLPETVVQWEIPSPSDGYYYFDTLPVRVYDASLEYLVGDIVYQNTFYWKALLPIPTGFIPTNNPTYWEQIPEDELYSHIEDLNSDSELAIADVTRSDEFTWCRADICYQKVVHASAQAGCKNCNKTANKDYIRVDSLLQDGYLLVSQTRYTEAHKTALLLQDICNDLTDCGC